MDVAGLPGRQAGALRHDLRNHPVQSIVLERELRPVPLPQLHPVAVDVVAILLVIALVGDPGRLFDGNSQRDCRSKPLYFISAR
jgi:hypothetical protein